MRAPEIFAWIFAISAGLLIANSFSSVLGFTTNPPGLEQYRPPSQVFSYDTSTSIQNLIGDIIWGFNMAMYWFGNLPNLAVQILGIIGVPEPLASILAFIAEMSLAAFIIYLIANKIIFQ